MIAERIPLSPPVIPPLTEDKDRPFWSVMIPAYNCSQFLKEAMESVIQQDQGPCKMQIEVVDDCSTDTNVEKLVKDIGRGRISYYKQPANVGSLRNFETCINRAKGHYIHLLHGDDRVKDGFYKKTFELIQSYPQAGAAFCAFDMIKENGSYIGTSSKEAQTACILQNWLYRLAEEPRLQYVCMVVKREVYENLGSFYLVTYGEDWEMWARIAREYPIAYMPEALAQYRVHGNSITGSSFSSGNNIRDIGKVIQKITEYLPEENRKIANKKARKNYAYSAVERTFSIWYQSRNRTAVNNQLQAALQLYWCPQLFFKSLMVQGLMILPQSWLTGIRNLVRGRTKETSV